MDDFFAVWQGAAVPLPDIRQPNVGYLVHDLKNNLETQQSPKSFACGGFDSGAQANCGPGAQNKGHTATPQQHDVRANHEPTNHDQSAAFPVRQASFTNQSVLIPRLPLTAAPVIHTEVFTSLPPWLSLVLPQPEDQVVWVQRECQVILDIKLKEAFALLGQHSVTWKNFVIPSTANVNTKDYCSEGDAVRLSVRVFGADTGSEYKSVCKACSRREGKKQGELSLVDFYAASNVIKVRDDGLVQVKFKFSCYPKHQSPNESAYM